jgi:hypothetical protein
MAKDKISILPLVRGPLDEESKNDLEYDVGCLTPKNSEDKPVVSTELVYPKGVGNTIPIGGGAILKLGGYPNIITRGEIVSGDGENNKGRILENFTKLKQDGYTKTLSKFSQQLSDKIGDSLEDIFNEAIPQLNEIRVASNRALENFPDIPWNKSGVPILSMRVDYSNDVIAFKKVLDDIKKAPSSRAIDFVGGFKFVPIEIVFDMIETIAGLKGVSIVGCSGVSFQDLAEKARAEKEKPGTLSDDDIGNLINEIFPIFNIPSSQLRGRMNNPPKIGYYTAYNNSLFIKTPNISTRGSDARATNYYELGLKRNVKAFYALETEQEEKYSIDPIYFSSGLAPFPMSSYIQYGSAAESFLRFDLGGLEVSEVDRCQFFLSPAISVQNPVGSSTLNLTNQFIELFSAPNMMNSSFKGRESTLSYESGEGYVASDHHKIFESLGQQIAQSGAFSPGEDGEIFKFDKDKDPENIKIGNNSFSIKDLGYPNTVDLSPAGIPDVGMLAGEMNRADVFLSNKSDQEAERKIRENDEQYFRNKLCSVSGLMSSNRPNFVDLSDSKNITKNGSEAFNWPASIPAIWIKNSSSPVLVKDEKTGLEHLAVPFLTNDLYMFTDSEKIRLVPYIIDNTGQIFKVAERQMELRRRPPNGVKLGLEFKFDGDRITKGSTYPWFVLKGDHLDGIAGIKFTNDADETQSRIRYFSDAEVDLVKSTPKHLEFSGQDFDANMGEFTGLFSNVADLNMELIGGNGQAYPVGLGLLRVVPEDRLRGETKDRETAALKIKAPLSEIYPDGYKKHQSETSAFETHYAYNVPVLSDGTSPKIKLASKSGILKPSNNLYAYLMICNAKGDDESENPIYDFSMDSQIIDVVKPADGLFMDSLKTGITRAQIAKNIEFKLGESGDFVSTADDEATLSFPGSFSYLNFSRLKNVKFAYFIICSQRIDKITSTNKVTSTQLKSKFALVRIGGVDGKDAAFISNPPVIGSFAKISKLGGFVNNCDVTTILNNKDKKILADADVWDAIKQVSGNQIIVKSKISRLGVVFNNYNPDFRYELSINGTRLPSPSDILPLSKSDRAVVVCDDILTAYRGWADVKVHIRDSLYGIEYDSSIYGGCTIEIKSSEDLNFSERGVTYTGEDIRIASTKAELEKPLSKRKSLNHHDIGAIGVKKAKPIDPRTIFLNSDAILQGMNSYKFRKTGTEVSISGINPLKIKPSLNVTVGEKLAGVTVGLVKSESKPDPKTGEKKEEIDLISASGSFSPPPIDADSLGDIDIDLGSLLGGGDPLAIKGPTAESRSGNGLIDKVDLKSIFIKSGTLIPPNLLLANDDGSKYKLTVKSIVENSAGIRFNIPELLYVTDHTGNRYYPGKIPAEPSGGKSLRDLAIITSKTLRVTTIGTDKNTLYFIADRRVDITGSLVFDGIKVTASIVVPPFEKGELDKFDPCKTIRISNANKEGKRLSLDLGDLGLMVDELVGDMVGGASDYAKGKIKELKKLIKKYLLKFTKFTMDVSSTSKEFINSFCDLSFHLTAELKFNLRNLQLLYIPIKIIMCIIDVLCALMNPWKTARAVVRLFACLYDLLLLLPQISIPVMLLNLLLHLLELLQCVFVKIIGWMIAINEIIVALDSAIKNKNYASIKALEKTLSEHIFSLNADIEVLEPILGILMMFLEMMELIFNFSCATGSGDMDMDGSDTCLDPTMIAGMVVGKAMPGGDIDPSKVLPMAQAYTQLPPECVTSNGNTPSNAFNGRPNVDTTAPGCEGGLPPDVLVEPVNGDFIISLDREHENIFLGEETEDGFENVNKDTMRFNSNEFDGTFGASFSKSVKYNSNSLDVKFEFNNGGKTDNLAFDWFFSMFYDPKLISDMQTLDSAPALLSLAGEDLVISNTSPKDDQTGRTGFISPVDGHTDYFSAGTNNIAPLTMPVSSFRREFDERGEPIEPLVETVSQKVFPGVPKVAMIDDDANVYFIKENGIQFSGNRIVSIKAKLINKLSASKMNTSREKKDVFRPVSYFGNDVPGEQIVGMQANATALASNNDQIDLNSHDFSTGNIAAEDFNANKLKANATGLIGFLMNFIDTIIVDPINAIFDKPLLSGLGFSMDSLGNQEMDRPAGGWEDGLPHPEYPIHNFMATSEGLEQLQDAVQTLNIFDFPRLYFFDMRDVADEIAQACQTADLNGALFDIDTPEIDPDRVWPDDFRPIVTDTQSCIQSLKDFVDNGSEAILDALSSSQSVEELLARLNGAQWNMENVSALYDTMRACVGNSIDDTCSWVVNPLNTGFKLVDDTEETDTPFVDPATDFNDDISDGVTEMPKVTGAAEYASGIGDYLLATVGEKAFIEILPRDSYDDPLSEAGDWSDKVRVEILKDTTGGTAKLVAPNEDSSRLIVKEGEKYIAAIQADGPGQVLIRAYICGIMVKAWAERGIILSNNNDAENEVDCIPDQAQILLEEEDFGPGSIMKIDRVLTIAYRVTEELAIDPDDNAGLAKSRPQAFGTKLEN